VVLSTLQARPVLVIYATTTGDTVVRGPPTIRTQPEATGDEAAVSNDDRGSGWTGTAVGDKGANIFATTLQLLGL